MGKTGPVSELQEDFLKTVRTQTLVLQRMIGDLLEFSRMEANACDCTWPRCRCPLRRAASTPSSPPLAEEGRLRLTQETLPDDLPEIDGDLRGWSRC